MSAVNNGRQNESLSYDSFSRKISGKPQSHFLWWCAGAHQDLLKHHPSEHAKYAGLGGVLLATFALAALSAGYAMFSVFDNPLWAVVFAFLWGLIIFNFDRFMVSTMRKYGVSLQKQLWMTVPRIALAVLIGVTIARPLELKIFEKEIATKVADNRHQKILLNDSLLESENQAVLSSARTEKDRLIKRKLALEDTLHQLELGYIREADGTGGSLQRGIEQLTRLKQQAYNAQLQQFTPELLQLALQIRYQDSLVNQTEAVTAVKRKQYEESLLQNVGFLEKNKALSDLSRQEPSVSWAEWLVSLLIILIETGPILSKLIMPMGPYDLAVAKQELLHMAASENEMQRQKAMMFDKMDGLYARKKQMSESLVDKITSLQQKHIDRELERWERGERSTADKAGIDELLRKIKTQYDFSEDNML